MKKLLRQFTQREAHPAIQFLKYGIAGGIATMVDIGVFYLLAIVVFPAVQPDDRLLVLLASAHDLIVGWWPAMSEQGWFFGLFHFDVQPIDEVLRRRNFLIDRCIVFFISNFTAYVLNMLWVFKPGKHSRHKEITLFYVVAIISFVIGTSLAWGLIRAFGISTTDAYAVNLVVAVLINYVCRKYWVFHG